MSDHAERLKVLGCVNPGLVILACACGRRRFADAGQRKYACDNCGAVEVVDGEPVAAKAAEPSAPAGGGSSEGSESSEPGKAPVGNSAESAPDDLEKPPFRELQERGKARGLKVIGVSKAALVAALREGR